MMFGCAGKQVATPHLPHVHKNTQICIAVQVSWWWRKVRGQGSEVVAVTCSPFMALLAPFLTTCPACGGFLVPGVGLEEGRGVIEVSGRVSSSRQVAWKTYACRLSCVCVSVRETMSSFANQSLYSKIGFQVT